jgi:hypothetical protein
METLAPPQGSRLAARRLANGAVEFHAPAAHGIGWSLMFVFYFIIVGWATTVAGKQRAAALLSFALMGLIFLCIIAAALLGETWIVASAQRLDIRWGLFGRTLSRRMVKASDITEIDIGVGTGNMRASTALRFKRRNGAVEHICSAAGDGPGMQWLAAELRRALRVR